MFSAYRLEFLGEPVFTTVFWAGVIIFLDQIALTIALLLV
jgi:hypothetical protein